jgi:type IV secretory pathway VirB10-like protein
MRMHALALVLATVACRDVDRDINSHAPAPASKPVETAPTPRVDETPRAVDEAPPPVEAPRPIDETPKTVEPPKTVEVTPKTDEGHEYARVRTQYETTSRERLAKLDARINELEQSASESAHQTAQELRKDRDELAMRIDQIREQAKPAWDDFQAKVDDGFQRLEKRLDDAVH